MSGEQQDFYFNPWDEGFKVNPYPHYKALHSGPPRLINLMAPIALIGKYDHAMRVLTDHDTFTGVKPDIPWINQQFEIFRGAPILQNSDPPVHTRLRRVIGKAFTPRMIASMEPHIQQVTDELFEAARSRGELEVMADIANTLPVIVIAEILGVPRDEYAKFKTWCDGFVAGQTNPPGMPVPPETHVANEALRAYFAEEIEKRKREPANDLLSAMVAAEESGEALTPDELLAFVVLLLIAGNETTTNLIGNGMLALARNPDQMARLRSEPAMMPKAIEEMMRYDPPIHVSLALPAVRKPVEIGGVMLEPGTLLFVVLAAANRDPAQFRNPDVFDIARDPNPHLSFGEGIHHCLGAPLARLEGRVVFNAALKKFPQLRLADPDTAPTYKGSYFFRGLKELRMGI
jgi:cytochrome P450